MNFLDFNISSATVFSADIDTFIYSGANANTPVILKMDIFLEGTPVDTIEETYTTDSVGLLKIYDLARLFNNYIQSDADFSVIQEPLIRRLSVTFTLKYGTTTKSCSRDIIYSRNPMSVYSSDFLSIPSLIRRKKTNTTRFEPFFFQTYTTDKPVITLYLAYLKNGVTYYPSATIADTSSAYTYVYVDLSVSNVIAIAAPGESLSTIKPLYYDVVVKFDGVQTDKMRFTIDNNYYPQESGILYYNLFGLPSTLPFTGQNNEKIEQEVTFGYVGNMYRALDRDLSNSHELNSGWISNEERPAYKDLLQSPFTAIYHKSGNDVTLEEIAITGIDWTITRPSNEPDNIKLTYRHAQKNQISLDVVPWAAEEYVFPHPPFDLTFD